MQVPGIQGRTASSLKLSASFTPPLPDAHASSALLYSYDLIEQLRALQPLPAKRTCSGSSTP